MARKNNIFKVINDFLSQLKRMTCFRKLSFFFCYKKFFEFHITYAQCSIFFEVILKKPFISIKIVYNFKIQFLNVFIRISFLFSEYSKSYIYIFSSFNIKCSKNKLIYPHVYRRCHILVYIIYIYLNIYKLLIDFQLICY